MNRLRRARFSFSGAVYLVITLICLYISIGLAIDLAHDSWHELRAKDHPAEAAGTLVARHGDLATVSFDASGTMHRVTMLVSIDARVNDLIPVTYSSKHPGDAYSPNGSGARIAALIVAVLFLVASYLFGDRCLRAFKIVGASTPRPLG